MGKQEIIWMSKRDIGPDNPFQQIIMAMLEAAETEEQVNATLKAFYLWVNEDDGHIWGNMPVRVQAELSAAFKKAVMAENGRISSAKKARASAENGKKGGRPKTKKENEE